MMMNREELKGLEKEALDILDTLPIDEAMVLGGLLAHYWQRIAELEIEEENNGNK
jgi:hypothetical protein